MAEAGARPAALKLRADTPVKAPPRPCGMSARAVSSHLMPRGHSVRLRGGCPDAPGDLAAGPREVDADRVARLELAANGRARVEAVPRQLTLATACRAALESTIDLTFNHISGYVPADTKPPLQDCEGRALHPGIDQVTWGCEVVPFVHAAHVLDTTDGWRELNLTALLPNFTSDPAKLKRRIDRVAAQLWAGAQEVELPEEHALVTLPPCQLLKAILCRHAVLAEQQCPGQGASVIGRAVAALICRRRRHNGWRGRRGTGTARHAKGDHADVPWWMKGRYAELKHNIVHLGHALCHHIHTWLPDATEASAWREQWATAWHSPRAQLSIHGVQLATPIPPHESVADLSTDEDCPQLEFINSGNERSTDYRQLNEVTVPNAVVPSEEEFPSAPPSPPSQPSPPGSAPPEVPGETEGDAPGDPLGWQRDEETGTYHLPLVTRARFSEVAAPSTTVGLRGWLGCAAHWLRAGWPALYTGTLATMLPLCSEKAPLNWTDQQKACFQRTNHHLATGYTHQLDAPGPVPPPAGSTAHAGCALMRVSDADGSTVVLPVFVDTGLKTSCISLDTLNRHLPLLYADKGTPGGTATVSAGHTVEMTIWAMFEAAQVKALIVESETWSPVLCASDAVSSLPTPAPGWRSFPRRRATGNPTLGVATRTPVATMCLRRGPHRRGPPTANPLQSLSCRLTTAPMPSLASRAQSRYAPTRRPLPSMRSVISATPARHGKPGP